jgi:hypothetical protein
MNVLCKFLLWSSLCCLLAMPIQAQAMGPSSSAAKDAPRALLTDS